ncbi:MAG TPA: hypothetical protein VK139_02720 [Microbacteriaceae bacterium]|nr:hypothetical protein [Microbacteriaceae bacterium]
MIGTVDAVGPHEPTCSRAGCEATGAWQVRWRNPRIHGEERVKVWLACAEHCDYLREFVAARNFLIDVVPLEHA